MLNEIKRNTSPFSQYNIRNGSSGILTILWYFGYVFIYWYASTYDQDRDTDNGRKSKWSLVEYLKQNYYFLDTKLGSFKYAVVVNNDLDNLKCIFLPYLKKNIQIYFWS